MALSVAEERTALPTLPLVAEALLRPEEQQARLLGTNLDGLRQDGRQVALELRRLVHGDLAGMFDGETSPGLDLSAGVVVLDLSRLYASPALGLLMVCALSWLQSTLALGSATKRLVVLDEAWALLEPSRNCTLAAGNLQAFPFLWGGQRRGRAPALGPESSGSGRF